MKKVRDLVERVKLEVSCNKTKVIASGLILSGLVVFTSGCTFGVSVGRADTVTKVEYDKANETISEYKEKVELKQSTINELDKDKQELQSKIDSAKDYFELDENEKAIVDKKIEEVNKATEEQKEAEKKAKEEEERAKKEAEEKAEAERKAAEEEAKRQEEERIAQEQAALQPYRDATAYLQQAAKSTGYDFKVNLNESTKTIEIVYDSGDTSVSDLRNIGYDDETILSLVDFEACYSSSQNLAVVGYQEVVAVYGISDVKVTVTAKIGGEKICTFNQNGECVYSIF